MRRSRILVKDNQPTRYYSKLQEKNLAKKIGGKQIINSGATMFQKGDVVDDRWLFEAKTVTKPQKSFSIKKEWIEKNIREKSFMGKEYHAVVFNFEPAGENYFVIDEQTFLHLKSMLDKEDEI